MMKVKHTSGEKVRVLFTLNGINNFISHRLGLASEMMAQGYEIHTAHPPCSQEKADLIASMGIISHTWSLDRKSINPSELFAQCHTLKKIINEVNPDLVIAVALKPVLLTMLLQRLFFSSMPTFGLVTGMGMLYSKQAPIIKVVRSVFESVLRYTLKNPLAQIIVQNRDDFEYFLLKRIVSINQLHLVHGSGVDVKKFADIPPSDGIPVVAFIGRFLREKGVFDFVSAIKQLNHAGVRANYLLVGGIDDNSASDVDQYDVEQWQTIKNTTVVPWQKDLIEIYACAHIICLPSYYREGVPKVLLEGLASARSIVTTDMPGCRDTVLDGKNGFLVRPHDVDGLVDALNRLLKDRDLCHRMGQASRELAWHQFDQSIIIRQIMSIVSPSEKDSPCAA